jgi:signal transduction histidine kinase
VLGQAVPERGENGKVTGFVGTLTDINELKATELDLERSRDLLEHRVQERTRELEAAKERAEHADRVKSTFLSTMSHELRTPLNSILGFTDVVLEGLSGPLTDEQRRHLGIVRDASVHLLGLINEVLDLSRIEAGQLRVEIGTVDLPELLRRRVQGFEAEAARKGLALSATIDGVVGGILSDAQRVSQIVDNLLSNAVKFTEAGSVSLAARLAGDRVEVDVRDTGPGIGPEDLPLLFKPFFTHPAGARGRAHEGVGLGLPISRHLAEALGGTIRVASTPGHGSTFTLTLPVAGPGAP